MSRRIPSILIVLVLLGTFSCGRSVLRKSSEQTSGKVAADTVAAVASDSAAPAPTFDTTDTLPIADPEPVAPDTLTVPAEEIPWEWDDGTEQEQPQPPTAHADSAQITAVAADSVSMPDEAPPADTATITVDTLLSEEVLSPPGDEVSEVPDTTASADSIGQERRKYVDFKADFIKPTDLGNDSTALNLLGNVVFYHNGSVLTCDSAVRYSPTRMDCFDRVVINKDATYIYGDRAEYHGDENTASIFAPIIKVVDDDATLYTYSFKFNTLDNIGEYGGGGTMSQGDHLMESKRGYYFADRSEFVGVDSVELKNPEYRMMSDSVIYNMDTELATFHTNTYIWNEKGEILSAKQGTYHHPTADYKFRSDAYILTAEQEVWADTMDYNSRTEDAVMYNNIQVRDDENSAMAFGDYGQYWGERQEGMLTRDPSLISFDPEQSDTLYLRSDSIFVFTFPKDHVFENEALAADDGRLAGEEEVVMPRIPAAVVPADTVAAGGEVHDHEHDHDAVADAPPADPVREDKKAAREERKRQKVERKAGETAEQGPAVEESVDSGEADSLAVAPAGEVVVDAEGPGNNGQGPRIVPDSLLAAGIILPDSVGEPAAPDSSAVLHADSLSVEKSDSVQRVLKAYTDVKIFRDDFQAVCDSLVGFSRDSTMHMYINPLMWTQSNQIKADIIILYTANEQLTKAEFRSNPFMTAEIDPDHYNQIKGRHMEAFFRDNEIYRHEVTGNGQTYYYMQDDDTKELMSFAVVESADIKFLIDDRQIHDIVWYTDIEWMFYPMDKIPAAQEQKLPGFSWEPERRPKTKEEVFDRTIRPSQRAAYEQLTEPVFPLTDRILKDRDKKIADGIWRERNDALSQSALDFIHDITNQ